MISSQVNNFIEKHNLSGKFLVAFSGGYDSMCLLDVLNKLGYEPIAIHLNHNWRGEESLQEEKNCEEFCKSCNITFYSETLDDNVDKTETAAREARYEFFRKCAKKFDSKIVFTAHNFDDNAETIIYRIIKGTGICGLEGIAEVRDIFYRPLLKTTRKDIENYCQNNNLTPNNDSSNVNTNYKRNLIRHKLLPLMSEINPKVIYAINSLSDIVKENCEEKAKIRELLIEHNIDYDRKKIDEIYKFIEDNKNSKSGKTLSLSSNLWLFVNTQGYKVIERTEKNTLELAITKEGEYIFGDYIFSILTCNDNIETFPDDSEIKAYISTDEINFTLRHRKDGDKIHPLGSKGSQKLKKYLNEKKIPQYKKDKILLLCKDKEVLWAAGLGLSENIKVKNKPTHIISLRKGNYGH